MEASRSAMDQAMRELYETGKYSDLTIDARENRITLKPKTRGCPQEVEDLEELGHDDPNAVKCMFEFIYLHEYGVGPLKLDNDATARRDELCLHANVYALGEKYEIAAMKETSLRKFADKAESSWNSEDFRNAVKIVFTTTVKQDSNLRDLVARILSEHRRELAPDSAVETTVRQVDGLAYRLWKMATTGKGPTCNVCQSVFVRRCQGCRKPGKGYDTIAHFVSCKCEEERRYCGKHHNQPEPPQDEIWGFD
ncbi:hypothetical protein KC367_g8948 [Hortaea werneckii]|nr:hypothetical protein KC357_g9102 [Hortaea werneckii]KAI7492888.1 hypothetical protein KC367_g8948 [Hortaea werneckii]